MKVTELYNLAINKGIDADLRGRPAVEKMLARRRRNYENLTNQEKADFDASDLTNPYADSQILYIKNDIEVKKVLVGIDIEPAEILMAKFLGDIDLIISHHPIGKGLANLSDVMELQAEVLSLYGVPINVAEGLMREKISEVARGLNAKNHQRTVDAARLMGFNLICCHTPCDNLAAKFLKEKIEEADPERLGDLLDVFNRIPEYREAAKIGAGPKIFVGNPESRCGKIMLSEITGGTEGSSKLYAKMAMAGIGTTVGMHVSEEHRKEAEAANINVLIAGHMSSDSLGVNLFLDELQRQGVEIIACSGLTRVSRV
ncbi:MAG TPA: NGG1p interacting factor NIF3 [Candidatus Paceibacterota bacterium]|nr:NGG1p interacting factor NIF3 [Candidatus Pacearchaeota archaeon]HRZ50762.1 NGG1p interacting factor NIF3 [Candidatus Paceibacterota bacterium]HSA36341.1 NGG1p interacting factor NIF3 [Candidatus Paceibacterota bacterium]